jgi:hypothetical protein
MSGGSIFGRKIRFTRPANRASPTIRDFLEGSPCGNAVFRISHGGIINIPTNIAGVLLHIHFSFRLHRHYEHITTEVTEKILIFRG